MTEDALRETLAVVVSRLDGVAEDVAEMRKELREDRRDYVTQPVWVQRNALVDQRLAGLGREVGDLRTQLEARRAPWWSLVAAVLAAAAFFWQVVGPAVAAAA